MDRMEDKTQITFLFDELITCGAVLSGFELCEALRRIGVDANICTKYNNKELEKYFNIEPIRRPKGITITFTPRLIGDYAYVRTMDGRWLNHEEPVIAVSKYIKDWIGGTIIGNGTHSRFNNWNMRRDIDVLIVGNDEPNKNIEETIKLAKKLIPMVEKQKAKPKIVWIGRNTRAIEGVENISSPSMDEIVDIYNRSKVLVSMSHNEGWGRPIAEATKCGCKIINKSGGNKDIKLVTWDSIATQLYDFIKQGS